MWKKCRFHTQIFKKSPYRGRGTPHPPPPPPLARSLAYYCPPPPKIKSWLRHCFDMSYFLAPSTWLSACSLILTYARDDLIPPPVTVVFPFDMSYFGAKVKQMALRPFLDFNIRCNIRWIPTSRSSRLVTRTGDRR